MNDHIHVVPEFSHYSGRLSPHLVKKVADGSVAVAEAIDFKVYQPNEQPNPAKVQLTHSEAQELIDRLWACGLRPTEGKWTAGLIESMKEHIGDLRKIAFGKGGNDGQK